MKRPEIQQILDWKLAKGLRFAQVYIAELVPCKASRVTRLRSKLGYCSPFTKSYTSLGQAVVMLALLRAQDTVPRHAIGMIQELTALLDAPNTPLPMHVAIRLEHPSQFWVGNTGSELFAQIEHHKAALLIACVPVLIEHLCNGAPSVYAETHGQAETA